MEQPHGIENSGRISSVYIGFALSCIITVTMADPNIPEGFAGCLYLCGIISEPVCIAVITAQSLNSFRTLVGLSDDGLDTTAENINKTRRTANQVPLVLNPIQVKRLKAMRLWALWQVRCSIPLREADFNDDCLQWGLDRIEFEERCKTAAKPDIPEPTALTKIGFDIGKVFGDSLKTTVAHNVVQ